MSIDAPTVIQAPAFLIGNARNARHRLSYKNQCFVYYKYVMNYSVDIIKKRMFIKDDKTYYKINKYIGGWVRKYNNPKEGNTIPINP